VRQGVGAALHHDCHGPEPGRGPARLSQPITPASRRPRRLIIGLQRPFLAGPFLFFDCSSRELGVVHSSTFESIKRVDVAGKETALWPRGGWDRAKACGAMRLKVAT
jgi:hypothetical protein